MQQWGIKGRKQNKSEDQGGKDEEDWKSGREEEVKASLEIDGVIVDCWSALILVSQGCCLRRLASFLPFKSPSLSRTTPNLATRLPLSIFPLSPALVLLPICVLSPPLSHFFYIIVASSHWAYLSLFLSFHPSLQTVRHHAEGSGLEKSSGNWGWGWGGSASRGSKVSLQQDRGGWGGKLSLCLSLSPPPRHTSQTSTSTTGLL